MNVKPVFMFQTAELGQSVSKSEFKKRQKTLRKELLDLQRDVRDAGLSPVLIDFAGVSGGGKGTSSNLLNKWMDPRWIHTIGYSEPSTEERQRPEFWRYWRDLPPRGQINISLSGRYHRPLLDFVHERIDEDQLEHLCERINHFETTLAADGALILKFWMHLNRDVQEKRLNKLKDDPLRQWKVKPVDWENWELYDRFVVAAEHIISHTNTGDAPWTIVEGEDFNHRHLVVGETLREAMQIHLKKTSFRQSYLEQLDAEVAELNDHGISSAVSRQATIVESLDLSLSLEKSDYESQRDELQARLAVLHGKAVRQGRTIVLVLEGLDAAGKGGSARQITDVIDARTYKVQPIAAPTQEEHSRHYLWRFWKRLPRPGFMTIFDRSWYGRVLVERIEGFASIEEWQRAYSEINDFEDQMLEEGTILIKFWFHVSKETQLERFKARENTPHKRWKLTDEDWRNHEKYDAYAFAAHEMIQRTSTLSAPWTLVESDDKLYGRIKVLDTVCKMLEKAVGESEPKGQIKSGA
ncbi:MAG TPA: polyphosphate:AMP phosphotransferase [Xanthomonadales bacterium]|nr:polyphosphate:AMP phosphotransferase [Xanthomonadales bacterium]